MAWKDFYDERNWTTKPAHTYAHREVWFPLANAVCSWEDEFHTLMLHDHVRMDAFRRAIRQAVAHLLRQRAPGDEPVRVLDIGTGYGILAFWAAEAASDTELVPNPSPGVRVYAVEPNPVTASRAVRELSAKNLLWDGDGDPANKILVFSVPSYRLNRALVANQPVLERFDPHFPNSSAFPLAAFDLIISETLGNIGDNEDGVRLLHHAALSYLKPGGHVIPAEVTSYVVPIADVASTPASVSLYNSVKDAAMGTVKAVSAEYLKELPNDYFNAVYDAVIPLDDYLGQKQQVQRWRFAPQQPSERKDFNYTIDLSFNCDRGGRFIGFKGFFNAVLVPEGVAGPAVTLSIESDDIEGRKTSDCWKHCYLPIAEPIEVAPGDRIVTSFQRIVEEPKRETFWYKWEGNVERNAENVGSFKQHYLANTPYHHATDPAGRSLHSFGVKLEWEHFGQVILPNDDDEMAELFKAAMLGLPPQGLVFDGTETSRASKEMDEYLANLSSKLDGCYIGFRSSKPGEFLWVTTRGRIPGPPDVRGWELRYVVDASFAQPPDFVSIMHLPYTKKAWEDWREQAWEARRTTEGKAIAPTFGASLIIPAESSAGDLLLVGGEELESLMHFLQVHVFISVLVQMRSDVQAGVMIHELKQRAEALAQFWLITPQEELAESIRELTTKPWAHQSYRIAPYPELITATGKRIILWAFYDKDPKLVFPDEQVPTTLKCLIETCWQMCLEDAKMAAVVDIDLNTENGLERLKPRLEWIHSALEPCLNVIRCPDVRSEFFDLQGNLQGNWMNLTRWLMSAFTDYMRHGQISAGGLRVSAETKHDRLSLSVQDKNRTDEDKAVLRRTALWFLSRIRSSGPQGLVVGPKALVPRGEAIKRLLAKDIDADYRRREDRECYEDYLELALEKLRGQ